MVLFLPLPQDTQLGWFLQVERCLQGLDLSLQVERWLQGLVLFLQVELCLQVLAFSAQAWCCMGQVARLAPLKTSPGLGRRRTPEMPWRY